MSSNNIAKQVLNQSDRQHLMLLYEDERERSSAEIASINQALADGCYCIYATVDADNNEFVTRLAPLINDYDRHIQEGNLRIVNFKPYYEFALKADMHHFDQLRADIELALRNRVAQGKKQKALVVADAACNMSRHKQFEECISLESWWQDTYNEWKENNLDITIVCAHPLSILTDENMQQRDRIANQHSMTIKLANFADNRATTPTKHDKSSKSLSILVVEPEPDIRTIYQKSFKSLPVKVDTVENGMDCLEKTTMSLDKREYDLIIIDTHIRDTSAIHVAKKILEKNPNQHIVFSSTWNASNFREELMLQSLDPEKFAILQKPFQFSQLLAVVKPSGRTRDN